MSESASDPGGSQVGNGPPRIVLDSFALLAYLNGEAGSRRVVQVLNAAQQGSLQVLLCTINLGEVLYITERARGLAKAQQVQALLEGLPIQFVEAARDLVLDAAHLKAHRAISYADAFAAALAVREKATLLTGDPEFNSVTNILTIEWLPRS